MSEREARARELAREIRDLHGGCPCEACVHNATRLLLSFAAEREATVLRGAADGSLDDLFQECVEGRWLTRVNSEVASEAQSRLRAQADAIEGATDGK